MNNSQLKKLLKKYEISQAELGREFGISRNMVNNWCKKDPKYPVGKAWSLILDHHFGVKSIRMRKKP